MNKKNEYNYEVKVKNIHTGQTHFVKLPAYTDKQATFLATMGVKGLKVIEITQKKRRL